jgi:hypothetical protein
LPALKSNGRGHNCITNGSAALANIRQSGLTTGLDGSGEVGLNDFGILGEQWSEGNWHCRVQNLVI